MLRGNGVQWQDEKGSVLEDAVKDRELLTSMTERQLRLVITEPPKRLNARVDAALADQVLLDIRDHSRGAPAASMLGNVTGAGILPLVSDALDRAWRNRGAEKTLTVVDYESVGGIESALADAAERVYDALTPEGKALARKIFVRLSIAGDDGTDTSDRVRRVDLAHLADADEVDAVLEPFAGERLLTLDTETVEISHEVLLRTWPRLRDDWLAETHTDRAAQTRIRMTAAAWRDNGGDSAYLYSGSVLETAVATAVRIEADSVRYAPLTPLDKDFLTASTRTGRRRTRQRHALIGGLLALVVALAAASLVAVRNGREATEQRDVSIARELVSRSELLSETDPFGSRFTALAAWRINPGAETRHAMLAAASNPRPGLVRPEARPAMAVAIDPDGRKVTIAHDRVVRMWNVRSGREDARIDIGAGVVWSMALSDDGQTVAAGDRDGTVRVWDVQSARQLGVFDAELTMPVQSMAVSGDGRTVAAGDERGAVRIWHVPSGREVARLDGEEGSDSSLVSVSSLALSNDGRVVASVRGTTAQLWDVESGRETGRIDKEGHAAWSVALSGDGRIAAVGDQVGTVWLLEVGSGRELGSFKGPEWPVAAVTFSADGGILAAGDRGGAVRLWEVDTGREVSFREGEGRPVASAVLSVDGRMAAALVGNGVVQLWNTRWVRNAGRFGGEIDAVSSVSLSDSGHTVISGDVAGEIRVWDIKSGWETGRFEAEGGPAQHVRSSVGGQYVGAIDSAGEARLWETSSGREIDRLTVDGRSVQSIAFRGDGQVVALGGNQGMVRLVEIRSGREIGRFTSSDSPVWSLAWSSDGRMLAAAGGGVTRIWEVDSGREIRRFGVDGIASWAAVLSADGELAAVSDEFGTVRIFEVASGRETGRLDGDGRTVLSMTFSPDGKTVAIGYERGVVQLWDVESGRPIGAGRNAHPEGVAAVVFTPDGRVLVSASINGVVRQWDVSFTTDVVAYLCDWADGEFTAEEWRRYLPEGPDARQLCP